MSRLFRLLAWIEMIVQEKKSDEYPLGSIFFLLTMGIFFVCIIKLYNFFAWLDKQVVIKKGEAQNDS